MSSLSKAVLRSSSRRSVNQIQRRQASHAPSYNEPSGNLFSEKPLKKGEKRVMEDWEMPYYIGMFGGMALAGVLLWYKPDTSIQTWARAEAIKRQKEAAGATENS